MKPPKVPALGRALNLSLKLGLEHKLGVLKPGSLFSVSNWSFGLGEGKDFDPLGESVSIRSTQDWAELALLVKGVVRELSNLSSLMLSLGVLGLFLISLPSMLTLELLAMGLIMELTALFILLGVLLKENALPTFCLVLWNDERALLKLDTLRSLASRLMSLAARLTRSWSGSGLHKVLDTWRHTVLRKVSLSSTLSTTSCMV